jgi:hypothetical protein
MKNLEVEKDIKESENVSYLRMKNFIFVRFKRKLERRWESA